MKKIIIIGCPGSGKTTFAKKLSERLGISLYHLDSIWHKPDRTHITREEFDLKLDELLVLEEYIIDGNYNRTLERRIMPSDTVILFDLDESVCLSGLWRDSALREMTYHGWKQSLIPNSKLKLRISSEIVFRRSTSFWKSIKAVERS